MTSTGDRLDDDCDSLPAEPTTLGMVESEEKGERDMAREIPTLTQYNRKKKSTLLKKKKIRWCPVVWM